LFENGIEMAKISQCELKKMFEDLKEVTHLLEDSEAEKVDNLAKVVIDKGFVKSYEIVWNQLDDDKRVNAKGKLVKENYKKMLLTKSKLKKENC
jgi:hypothetical protein